MHKALTLLLGIFHFSNADNCITSKTKVSGTHAPLGTICSGDLIFQDDFNEFDLKIWDHEQTLAGGGNWEFQWYTNNRSNTYVRDGNLYIKPTLVADDFGENFLSSGTIDVNGDSPVEVCSDPRWYGCIRTGTRRNILNPIKSAKIRTVNSFSFRYGKLEVRARLPAGDWLWPAIWLMPRYNQYSSWPSSGEIDLMESRGNKNLLSEDNIHIGVQQVSSTLHWGPNLSADRYKLTTSSINNSTGFDKGFHIYQIEWDENQIKLLVDGNETVSVAPPEGGFWELGNFTNSQYNNPWEGTSKMAPFDQEFYIIINLACGGISYFPDTAKNDGGKPWLNNSTKALTDFWEGRHQWLPTWDLKGELSAFQIDYLKVWAL